MKSFNATIQTELTKSEMIEQLKKEVVNTQTIWEIFSNKFVVDHNFSENSLKFSTFQNPPIIVEANFGEIDSKGNLDILIKHDSHKKSFISGIYAFCYPIIFAGALYYSLQNPIGFWFFFWTLLLIGVVYIGTKIFVWWEYKEPDPHIILNKLAKIVDGEITSPLP